MGEEAQASSGWEIWHDEASGKDFYYLRASGECRWEQPEALRTVLQADQNRWEGCHDPTSGRVYYRNIDTLRCSWEPPLPSPDDGVVVATGEDDKEELKKDEPPGCVLPEPWKRHWDEASSLYFYYNETTGESRWDPPPVTTSSSSSNSALSEPLIPPSSVTPTTQDEQAVSPLQSPRSAALSEEWVLQIDLANGTTFYWNAETATASWEKPELSGWEERYDETSHRTFYHHKKCQISQWTKPRGWTKGTNQEPQKNDGPRSTGEEWQAIADPSSGKTFYYNPKTGQSVWEKPTSLIIAEDPPVPPLPTASSQPQPAPTSPQPHEALPLSPEEIFFEDNDSYNDHHGDDADETDSEEEDNDEGDDESVSTQLFMEDEVIDDSFLAPPDPWPTSLRTSGPLLVRSDLPGSRRPSEDPKCSTLSQSISSSRGGRSWAVYCCRVDITSGIFSCYHHPTSSTPIFSVDLTLPTTTISMGPADCRYRTYFRITVEHPGVITTMIHYHLRAPSEAALWEWLVILHVAKQGIKGEEGDLLLQRPVREMTRGLLELLALRQASWQEEVDVVVEEAEGKALVEALSAVGNWALIESTCWSHVPHSSLLATVNDKHVLQLTYAEIIALLEEEMKASPPKMRLTFHAFPVFEANATFCVMAPCAFQDPAKEQRWRRGKIRLQDGQLSFEAKGLKGSLRLSKATVDFRRRSAVDAIADNEIKLELVVTEEWGDAVVLRATSLMTSVRWGRKIAHAILFRSGGSNEVATMFSLTHMKRATISKTADTIDSATAPNLEATHNKLGKEEEVTPVLVKELSSLLDRIKPYNSEAVAVAVSRLRNIKDRNLHLLSGILRGTHGDGRVAPTNRPDHRSTQPLSEAHGAVVEVVTAIAFDAKLTLALAQQLPGALQDLFLDVLVHRVFSPFHMPAGHLLSLVKEAMATRDGVSSPQSFSLTNRGLQAPSGTSDTRTASVPFPIKLVQSVIRRAEIQAYLLQIVAPIIEWLIMQLRTTGAPLQSIPFLFTKRLLSSLADTVAHPPPVLLTSLFQLLHHGGASMEVVLYDHVLVPLLRKLLGKEDQSKYDHLHQPYHQQQPFLLSAALGKDVTSFLETTLSLVGVIVLPGMSITEFPLQRRSVITSLQVVITGYLTRMLSTKVSPSYISGSPVLVPAVVLRSTEIHSLVKAIQNNMKKHDSVVMEHEQLVQAVHTLEQTLSTTLKAVDIYVLDGGSNHKAFSFTQSLEHEATSRFALWDIDRLGASARQWLSTWREEWQGGEEGMTGLMQRVNELVMVVRDLDVLVATEELLRSQQQELEVLSKAGEATHAPRRNSQPHSARSGNSHGSKSNSVGRRKSLPDQKLNVHAKAKAEAVEPLHKGEDKVKKVPSERLDVKIVGVTHR